MKKYYTIYNAHWEVQFLEICKKLSGWSSLKSIYKVGWQESEGEWKGITIVKCLEYPAKKIKFFLLSDGKYTQARNQSTQDMLEEAYTVYIHANIQYGPGWNGEIRDKVSC